MSPTEPALGLSRASSRSSMLVPGERFAMEALASQRFDSCLLSCIPPLHYDTGFFCRDIAHLL